MDTLTPKKAVAVALKEIETKETDAVIASREALARRGCVVRPLDTPT